MQLITSGSQRHRVIRVRGVQSKAPLLFCTTEVQVLPLRSRGAGVSDGTRGTKGKP